VLCFNVFPSFLEKNPYKYFFYFFFLRKCIRKQPREPWYLVIGTRVLNHWPATTLQLIILFAWDIKGHAQFIKLQLDKALWRNNV